MSQSNKRPRHTPKDGPVEEEDSSSPTTKAKQDAFAILLASSQKSTSPSSPSHHGRRRSNQKKPTTKNNTISNTKRMSLTRFVPCPAGCGQHVAVYNMDRHLDKCFRQRKRQGQAQDHTSTTLWSNGSNSSLHSPDRINPQTVEGVEYNKTNDSVIQATTSTGASVEDASMSKQPDHRFLRQSRMTDASAATDEPCVAVEMAGSHSSQSSSLNQSVAAGSPTIGTTINAGARVKRQGSVSTKGDTQEAPSEMPFRESVSPTENLSTPMSEKDGNHNEEREDSKSETSQSDKLRESSSADVSNERTNESPPGSNEMESNELFRHMMARSKQVFQPKHKDESAECWFSLTDKGVSIWSTATGFDASVPPSWTSTIKLRNGPTVHLTTSIASAKQRRRYSKHHSRLSVPVLKSILQKSIRRRKPLPSVRVAFELADKSLGDFLRRIPIIVLEDSTLHPDIGVLVWLMMAQSKDYEPSPMLMEHVFRVVFEVASCQWQDRLDSRQFAEDEEISVDYTKILSDIETTRLSKPVQQEHRLLMLTCVWSMLVRASYGGMHGDVKMLYGFASLWYSRSEQEGPLTSALVMSPALVQDKCDWCQVPVSIHQRSREQSLSGHGPFMDLFRRGIDYLLFTDITVEGVDFHCSAVVDHLMRDDNLVQLSTDLMILSNEAGFPQSHNERLTWFSRIWKSCMWDYGSGVNFRRPLVAGTNRDQSNTRNRSSNYEHLWKSLAAGKALEFQTDYVRKRLFTPR